MKQVNRFDKVPPKLLKKWQELANILAEMLNIPAALIMKTEKEYMEVFISSESEGNPYKPGGKEKWDGLYCETVIKTQNELLIPNALKNKDWDKNPDIELGMISYLGYPINFPDKTPFGTICVLDSKENPYSEVAKKIIQQYKNTIELDLELIEDFDIEEDDLKETIREQHQALIQRQKALAESEEKYRMLSEMNSEGVAIHEKGLIISVNRAFCNIFGYSEKELIGSNPIEKIFTKESLQLVRKNINKRIEKTYNVHAIKKNGDKIYIEVEGRNIIYKEKNVRLTRVRDITELKAANAELEKYKYHLEELVDKRTIELKESKEKLDLAICSANLGTWDWFIPTGKVDYNQQWADNLGYSTSEIKQHVDAWKSLMHTDDRDRVNTKLNDNLKGKTAFYEAEHRLRSKNGEWKWVLAIGRVVERDKNGNPLRHIGVQMDITERKRTENELLENEKLLRQIAENFPKAYISVIKKDFTIGFTSGQEFKNLSLDPNKFIGLTVEEVYGDKAEFIRNEYSEAFKGHVRKFELFVNKQIQNYIVMPLENEDGEVDKILSVIQNITESRENENRLIEAKEATEKALNELKIQKEQLEKTQQQLIQSEKMASIGILSAGIAHEINNPVNYISGGMVGIKNACQRIKTIVQNNDLGGHLSNEDTIKVFELELNTLDKMILGIDTGVKKTTQIINSMKAFSSSSENHFIEVDVSELFQSTLTVLYNSYKERINIREYYHENSIIKAIPGKLQQVFMNLLANAIQAIPDKGEIDISTKWDENIFCISVKDNGTGITPEIKKRIFEPFFSTKKVGGGIGLGLYLSYSYIEQHSGKIKVRSKNGETEFLIELPQDK